ncbi:hypothetical protein SCHPADRAFT_999763 [Schizopora paradoxa]|uniref:MARVEL domain-containing protein n=1 Tax=Schizopora paradoxa TaxID=27342 RepID=A0A0H2RED4_9AGAM|nr:hypothetical protein SCHPADRAFT_999763 [Schizopora paradoxa]
MRTFWLARVGTFATLILFSVIVLGLSAFFISKTSGTVAGFSVNSPAWANLALATSILTLVSVTPMLVLDMFLDAHTSKILVELIVLGILNVLWLASGADAAAYTNGEVPDCSNLEIVVGLLVVKDNTLITLCRSYQAIEAFSWLNWIILMGYVIALLVFAILASTRGNSVWMSSVRKADFSAKGGNSSNGYPMTQQGVPANPQAPAPYNQNSYNQSPSMYTGTPTTQHAQLAAQV